MPPIVVAGFDTTSETVPAPSVSGPLIVTEPMPPMVSVVGPESAPTGVETLRTFGSLLFVQVCEPLRITEPEPVILPLDAEVAAIVIPSAPMIRLLPLGLIEVEVIPVEAGTSYVSPLTE